MKKVRHFFWWCAGADREILEQCPTEYSKYTSVGATVLFTACMAALAGGYALYSVFDSIAISVILGLFWGALIFNLDRYIVSTFGVGDGKKTISLQELYSAAPRLVMAILIGFVIAVPLETRIFKKEIDKKIKEMINNDKKAYNKNHSNASLEATVNQEIFDLEANIQALEAQVRNINTPIDLQNRRKDAEAELGSLTSRLKQNENSQQIVRGQIYRDQKQLNDARDADEKKLVHSLTDAIWSANKRLTQLRKEHAAIAAQLGKKRVDVGKIKIASNAAIDTARTRYEADLKSMRVRKDAASLRLSKIRNTRDIDDSEYAKIASNYNGLMAQLVALDSLSYKHVMQYEYENGEKTIVSEATVKTPIWYAKWLITLLLIVIEIAPILFKMMSEEGPYDYILNRKKHEANVRELQRISNMNESINVELRITKDKNIKRLEEEVRANEELLKAVADAQLEIAKASIDEWKEMQLGKVRNNYEEFIKTAPSVN